MTPAKHRIFLVDDHPVVRLGLSARLQQEPDLVVCGEAATAGEALQGVENSRPDLVVVDLSLVGSSGLELIKDLQIRSPNISVVVLSMHDEMVYAERALRAGARAYVMKRHGSQQIIAAIRRVLSGKVFVSEQVMTAIASKLGKPKSDASPIERLSDREMQVFEMLGEALSTAEIAEHMHVSIKTVQMYFARIKSKLAVSSAKEVLREAFRWHDSTGR